LRQYFHLLRSRSCHRRLFAFDDIWSHRFPFPNSNDGVCWSKFDEIWCRSWLNSIGKWILKRKHSEEVIDFRSMTKEPSRNFHCCLVAASTRSVFNFARICCSIINASQTNLKIFAGEFPSKSTSRHPARVQKVFQPLSWFPAKPPRAHHQIKSHRI
jgi:hypothetical protein